MKQTTSATLSPRSKVKAIVGKKKDIPGTVKRHLLFGEALAMQLKETKKNLTNEKQRRLFSKILSGHILKKYRLLGKAQPFLSYREHRKSINCKDLHCERKKKIKFNFN